MYKRQPTAWYLIAEESKEGNFVGFSHFRFDMDCSCDEVLYVYDIQIDSAFQGKGLGNFMMTCLETIGKYSISLFRNKMFMLDGMTKQRASKFAIISENALFFRFSFRATLDLLQYYLDALFCVDCASTVTNPK